MAKNDNKAKDTEIKAGSIEEVAHQDELEVSAPATPKAKTIEVSEETLRKLIDSNEKMSSKIEALESNAVATQPTNGMVIRKKTTESDIKVRKWNDKYVVGMVNIGNEKRPRYVYDIIDKETKRAIQYCNLILEDGEIVEGVVDIDFRRDAETEIARVVSKVEHEDVKEYGYISKKDMAENGYGMFETMVLVPVEVTEKSWTYKVKVPDREDLLEVNSQWANM